MFGPVQRLRIYGCCCPCLESDEDYQLRQADLALKSVPIRWLRKIKHPSKAPSASLFDGLCNCGAGAVPPQLTEPTPSSPTAVAPYIAVNANLQLKDTGFGPAIRITSNQFVFADDDAAANSVLDGSGVKGSISESVKMTKTIPLREVRAASVGSPEEWAAMGLTDAKNSGVIVKSKHGGSGMKVLVFEVCPASDGSAPSASRDDVVHHINTAIEWERHHVEKKQGGKANATAKKDDEGKDFVLMDDNGGQKASDQAKAKDEVPVKAEAVKMNDDAGGNGVVAVATATLVPSKEAEVIPAEKTEIV